MPTSDAPIDPATFLRYHGAVRGSRNMWRYKDVKLGSNDEQAARSLWLLLLPQDRVLIMPPHAIEQLHTERF